MTAPEPSSWWAFASPINFTARCASEAPRMSASREAAKVPDGAGATPSKQDVEPIAGYVR